MRIFISDKKRANVDVQRKLDMEATQLVSQALILQREVRWAETFLKTGVWGKDITPAAADKWNASTGNPIEQVKDACLDIQKKSAGRRPNKMIVSRDVWKDLTENDEFLARAGYGSGGGGNANPIMVTRQAIAALFEVDEIIIMDAIVNKAIHGIEDDKGNPAVDNEFVATGCALLIHVPKTVGLMMPCAGMTFAWDSYLTHQTGIGPSMRRYRPMDGRKGEYIEAEFCYSQKIVAPDLAAFFNDVIA